MTDNITITYGANPEVVNLTIYEQAGAMMRSTYDSNGNNIVDNSEKLGGILPAGYSLSNHNHTSVYEPIISTKNTAFNKNFGTTTGTVLEGRTFGSAANNNTGDFATSTQGINADTALQPSSDGSIALPKTSGVGIKIKADMGTPTYGWKDLVGFMLPDIAGAGAPTLSFWTNGATSGVRRFAFTTSDMIDCEFHVPHDYAPNTNIFIHYHWGHNGTAISGDQVVTYTAVYAKGHNQANFTAPVTLTSTYATTNIATTPQYRHRIEEIQLSAAGGAGGLLVTENIEVDGVIGVNFKMTTIPTITGGTPNRPFVLFVDLHYQSTQMSTKNKAPNFYE
jgi:hypothetical protein